MIPSISAEWVDSHLHPLRHANEDKSENLENRKTRPIAGPFVDVRQSPGSGTSISTIRRYVAI
jgi:hypothetical protein